MKIPSRLLQNPCDGRTRRVCSPCSAIHSCPDRGLVRRCANHIRAQCGLMPLDPTSVPSMQDFGAGVGVDGDMLVVAKRQFAAGDSGSVYIFDRTETNWEFAQELRSPVGQSDRFGYSIASPLILAFRGWPIASGGGVPVTIDKHGLRRVTSPNGIGACLQSHFHMGSFGIFIFWFSPH